MKRVVFFFLLFYGVSSIGAESPPVRDDYGAVVNSVSGGVKALKKNAEVWVEVAKNDAFSSGDIIKTFADGSCEVYLIDGTIFEIGPNSILKIEDVYGENNHLKRAILDLEMGELLSEIETGLDYSVRTPQAVCAVRGTKFAVKLGESKESQIAVFKGSVGVRNYEKSGKLAKNAQIVKKMQETRVRLYEKPRLSKRLSADMQKMQKRMIKNQARRTALKREIIKRRKELLKARKEKIIDGNRQKKNQLIKERSQRKSPAGKRK
ncbi:FecR family protein [bacterium]|nr:FecR family protein [bacterium]